jgi:hypothetical protein
MRSSLSDQATRISFERFLAAAPRLDGCAPLVSLAALDGGDDLHGRVSAANAALVEVLAPQLSGESREYLTLANRFVLNVIMAARALMIGAGEGIVEGRLTASAGFIGAHPAFPPDLKLGLDIDAKGPARGVMLAAVDADGGLVGRGVAPWPTSP